jgi:RNA polymerase sigma-70 factor (ECF subfamily)
MEMTHMDRYQLGPLLERMLAPEPDPQAMSEFFTRIRPYLHGVVRKVLGASAQGPLDHSNLVQSSLRRIFANLDELRTRAPTVSRFLSYVERIVRNRCIDELRKQSRRQVVLLQSDLLTIPESSSISRQQDIQNLRLAEALTQLRERRRQVIEMYWFDDLTDAEIAQRLGSNADAIRVLRHRALQDLRRLMEADHEHE